MDKRDLTEAEYLTSCVSFLAVVITAGGIMCALAGALARIILEIMGVAEEQLFTFGSFIFGAGMLVTVIYFSWRIVVQKLVVNRIVGRLPPVL